MDLHLNPAEMEADYQLELMCSLIQCKISSEVGLYKMFNQKKKEIAY
jgi:hypothetical protein